MEEDLFILGDVGKVVGKFDFLHDNCFVLVDDFGKMGDLTVCVVDAGNGFLGAKGMNDIGKLPLVELDPEPLPVALIGTWTGVPAFLPDFENLFDFNEETVVVVVVSAVPVYRRFNAPELVLLPVSP